jgi:uncharacterized protein (DUF58 family)
MVRLVAFLALWLFIFITALAGGWSIMFKISYLLLLLFVVAWLWTRAGVWWLDVRREPLTIRGQVGSTMEERVVVRNLRWLPKPWLEIDAASTMPEHQTHVAASLGPHEERAWSLATVCQRRGRYLLGPTTVTAGDPFGIFQRQRIFDSDVAVVVYPETLDVPGFRPLEGELPGGGQRRERVPYSTPMVTGIRDYQPGDPYNRIHWPNSARTGRLLVKEFEQDPVSDVWLVLDLDRNTHLGSGPGSTEEDAVTITASMAKHFLLQNRAVGLVSQGHALQPDRGTRQLVRCLELLAVVRVRDFMPLGDLLVSSIARFGRGSATLMVTPTVREDWLGASADLRLRGVRSAVVLLEASTYGSTRPSTALVGALAAVGMPTYLVKKGQPLAEALAQESASAALPGAS